MRVKIAYTVRLEEVEKEVAEIITRAADDLDFCYQEIVSLQNSIDSDSSSIEKNIETIKTMRERMYSADQILNDCGIILEGLENVRKELEESEHEIQNG